MKTKHIFAALALACTAAASAQQNTASGYFVDDYTYRFEQNPAMGNSRNFVSIPAIGNINVGLSGNLALSDVLYNVDGRTSLFLNPGVSTSEVMGNIHDTNRLNANVKIGVLSAGFKAFGGYNTVAINARVSANVQLPRSIFSLLKEGVANQTYDITDIRAQASGYIELGLGHSRDITSEWRVGGTLKFLIGGANADAILDKATLTLGEDTWTVQAQGQLRSSIKGLTYDTKVNDRTGHRYVSGMDIDGTGLNGFGLGIDLGAVYSPKALPDWQFSIALLDLGFIHWNNCVTASTNGLQTFETDRYTFNADDDASNSFSNEWDRLRDDFSAIYELDDLGDTGGRSTSLAATFNIGARYTFPLYRPLTFGLLNTTVINGPFTTTDFRLSANVAPCKVFAATVNGSVGTYGGSFGWLANLHVTGFNFFLGMDHTLGKLAKQGVPLSSNAQVNFGMNILF